MGKEKAVGKGHQSFRRLFRDVEVTKRAVGTRMRAGSEGWRLRVEAEHGSKACSQRDAWHGALSQPHNVA